MKTATNDDLTQLASQGLSANQIATRLNMADLRTANGKKWYDSTVITKFRDLFPGATLESLYPRLAADAAKYDNKQAAKKAKAKKASQLSEEINKPSVVLPSTRTPASSLSSDFGQKAIAEAGQDIGNMAKLALQDPQPVAPAVEKMANVSTNAYEPTEDRWYLLSIQRVDDTDKYDAYLQEYPTRGEATVAMFRTSEHRAWCHVLRLAHAIETMEDFDVRRVIRL